MLKTRIFILTINYKKSIDKKAIRGSGYDTLILFRSRP